MKYARKSAIVDIEIAQENGFVSTWSGDIPYFKNNIIASNDEGDVTVVTQEVFDRIFTPILEKESVKTEFTNEQIESDYTQPWVGNDNEDYISWMKIGTNKAF